MAAARNDTSFSCLLLAALLVMSTVFLSCNAYPPGEFCSPMGECMKPVRPKQQQYCKDYCKDQGYNPDISYCVHHPEPECCCFKKV